MNKLRKFLYSAILGLALSSCAGFPTGLKTVTNLEINDLHNAYLLGDVYKDVNELKITATYSDGFTEEVPLYKTTVSLVKEGRTYDYKSPFTEEGTYKLTTYLGATKSNTIDVKVYSEQVYVTDFSLTTTSPNTIKTMDEVTVTVTGITPSDCTVEFEAYSNKESTVIKKNDRNSFSFYESREGTTTIVVRALSGIETYISKTIDFTVEAAVNETTIAQTYKDLSTRNCPTSGDVKLLVIPLWLTDSADFFSLNDAKTNIRNDIKDAYFGTEGDTGWHSVSSYYRTESRGALNITGTVSEWYEPDLAVSDIGNDDSSKATNTQALVTRATNWYFTNHQDESRSDYDSDGDGYLDGVIVIYAAPDCASNGVDEDYQKYSNLWAFCFYVESAVSNVSNPVAKTFFWASYDFMYGVKSARDKTGSNYYKGSTTYCKIDTHTYIHEMGHVFGLEDYYDYSNNAYLSAGGFSMQDYNVGGHDPFSVMSFGWVKPFIPTDDCSILLHSFQSSGELILLTPEWNSYNSPFDEYILLELYTPDGLNNFDVTYQYTVNGASYPRGPNAIGVRMWHVDARLTYTLPGQYSFSTELTSNAKSGHSNLITAFSNTYMNSNAYEPHVSPLARSNPNYSYFNLLSLIRNDVNSTHIYQRNTGNLLNAASLFKTGDRFDFGTYGKQFAYKDKFGGEKDVLNSGKEFNWSISFGLTINHSIIVNLDRLD